MYKPTQLRNCFRYSVVCLLFFFLIKSYSYSQFHNELIKFCHFNTNTVFGDISSWGSIMETIVMRFRNILQRPPTICWFSSFSSLFKVFPDNFFLWLFVERDYFLIHLQEFTLNWIYLNSFDQRCYHIC